MAKIDWNSKDIVKPADMNGIGQEINELRTAVDNIDIPSASLTEAGIVQLSNATDGTRENVAVTEKALREVASTAAASLTAGNERKAEVVAALVALGVSASVSETWDQLIPKMASIITATGNAVAGDVLTGKTFSTPAGKGIVGTMPNKLGAVVATGTSLWPNGDLAAYMPSGYYKGGPGDGELKVTSAQLQAAAAHLRPANLPKDTNIFGVVGTLERMTTAERNAIIATIVAKGQVADQYSTNAHLATCIQNIGLLGPSYRYYYSGQTGMVGNTFVIPNIPFKFPLVMMVSVSLYTYPVQEEYGTTGYLGGMFNADGSFVPINSELSIHARPSGEYDRFRKITTASFDPSAKSITFTLLDTVAESGGGGGKHRIREAEIFGF
ncbi:hypothetical protein J2T12_003608 [Paenibacillus anaericanus]|uniref:phage tail protein n=1 Tax=Paenibacillus anaericanus TaxID=170367 RepID=UPI002789225D|nr:phage tail protein [Paenibacillus anaericanus]MDQ0090194.1 hypothetical protein [Paenibacillus anaericanus]